jgi:hypothetical protein
MSESQSSPLINEDEYVRTYSAQFGSDRTADAQACYGRNKELLDLGMLGLCEEMQGVFWRIRMFSQKPFPVFILGETGTGKELAAKAMHSLDATRSGRPFVSLNCSGLSPYLLESELFGHAKGSFTGAAAEHAGYFEEANGGVLFLDEIGDMPIELQAKILRATNAEPSKPNELSFSRLGDTQQLHANIRLITAAQKLTDDKDRAVVREDLYARLSRLKISLPPLRQRLADFPLLVYAFFKRFNLSDPDEKVEYVTKDFVFSLFEEIQDFDAANLPSGPNIGATGGRIPSGVPVELKNTFPMNVRQLETAILDACIFASIIDGKRVAWMQSEQVPMTDLGRGRNRDLIIEILKKEIREGGVFKLDELLDLPVGSLKRSAAKDDWSGSVPTHTQYVILQYFDKVGPKFRDWESEYWKIMRYRHPKASNPELAKLSGVSVDTVRGKLKTFHNEKFVRTKRKKA